jgi:hypothetical protein
MKKQIISEEFLRMQKLAGLITESEFKRQVIKEMRIFDLKDKNGKPTELFKIEDFTTTEDAIKVLNKHFGLSGEDDDTIYTDETGTDYNYVYVANDGSARFVKSLDEFSEGYNTEEEWRVASSEEIKEKLNENESSSFKIGQEVIYADENPNELKKILDISSYEDNQDEIDADIEEFGWEQQSETPKEDLTWYKLDF